MLGLGLSITKALSTLGAIITTNLKMWLGFETSETLGREEVVNGDFSDGTTGWLPNDWTISNNVAASGNTSSLLQQTNVFINSTGVYKSTFKARSVNGTNETLRFYDGLNEYETFTITSSDFQDFTLTRQRAGDDSTLYIFNNLDAEIEITNISVKELTQITPDKSGNNNVGELFTGRALDFNGSTDYVTADGFAGTLSDNTAFTIVMWFKSNQVSQAHPYQNIQMSGLKSDGETNVFKFGASANSTLKGIHYQDTAGPSNNYKINNTVNYNDNVWHRLVISRSSGTNPQTANFYVDGVNIGNCPSQIVWSDLAKFSIGQEYDSGNTPSDFFKGLISDVQIYDKDWLQADVTYDYANPNKLAIDNPNTSLSVTNLKAYWALSEGDGSVAYDSGTNLEGEEVVDGDFPTGTTAWGLLNGATISDNKANIIGDGTLFTSINQTGVFENNKVYEIVADVTITSGLGLKFQDGANNENIGFAETTGVYTFNFTGTSNADLVVGRRTAGTAFDSSVNNISVREVTASDHGGIVNGATYVDAQPRIPQLGMMNWSKGSNLVTHSEDFTDNSWTKLGAGTGSIAIVTSNFDTSPIGTQNATRLQCDLNGGTTTADQSLIYDLDSSNTSQCISIYMKSNNGSNQNIYFANTFTGDNRDNAIVTTDWQRFEFKHTTSNHTFSLGLRGGTDSDDTADILIWGAQSEDSSSASAYRLTDGEATLNSTVIPNPNNTSQDILGNAVRDRLNSFNLGKFGGARPDAFTLSGNQATIQLWFKNVNSNDSLYLADLHSATDRIVIGFNSSQLSIFHEITGSWQNFGVITDGDWNFATFTFDGTSLKCFVGTSQLGVTKTITAINIGTTTDFGIGMNNYFSTRTQDYNGHISDFLIYDRVLTSTEIENNYNAGLSAHTN